MSALSVTAETREPHNGGNNHHLFGNFTIADRRQQRAGNMPYDAVHTGRILTRGKRFAMLTIEHNFQLYIICADCGAVVDFTDCDLGELEQRLS